MEGATEGSPYFKATVDRSEHSHLRHGKFIKMFEIAERELTKDPTKALEIDALKFGSFNLRTRLSQALSQARKRRATFKNIELYQVGGKLYIEWREDRTQEAK